MTYYGEKFFSKDVIELNNKKFITFKGGGGKGNAYLGVIEFLESEKMNKLLPLRAQGGPIIGVSGASAGAITALTVALGMHSKDIRDLMKVSTSKFFKKDGFKFEYFMTEDDPLPGVYRAVEILPSETGYITNIGYTHDSIYQDDVIDKTTKLKAKRKRDVFNAQQETAEKIDGWLKDNDSDYQIRNDDSPADQINEDLMKKLAKFRIDVAGGKNANFSQIPIVNNDLDRLNKTLIWKFLTPQLFRLFENDLLTKIHNGTASPIEKAIGNRKEVWKYIYNLVYDRGLFSGSYVREHFKDLIDYYLHEYHKDKYKLVRNKYLHSNSSITFKDFVDVTGVDLRVGATNMTAGENVIFSAFHTPFFPVSEAVAMSMNIPGVFKPIYLKNKDVFGAELEHKNSNLKSGLYVDSGLTNNMPMKTFFETYGDVSNNILGFRVIEGPNPKTFNFDEPYIFDNTSMYPFENRKLYANYLMEYLAMHKVLPPRKFPISSGFISPTKRGFLGTTLFSTLLQILETVLNSATLNDVDTSLEKNLLDVYSYDISTLDFSPNDSLLKFVTNQAQIRAEGLLKYTL